MVLVLKSIAGPASYSGVLADRRFLFHTAPTLVRRAAAVNPKLTTACYDGRMIATPEFAKRSSAAFTLLELSVVLVGIGLLVGGILVGKDLVVAATIRSQITQVEQFQNAVKTFKLKYDCMPGDCSNAAQFGLASRGTSRGQGDGNGILKGSSNGWGAYGVWASAGELLTFWHDLSKSGLIAEQLIVAVPTTAYMSVTTSSAPFAIIDFLPVSKLRNNVYVSVYSDASSYAFPVWNSNGINYFSILAIVTINRFYQSATTITDEGGVSVAQAYAIDTKIDNGLPITGRVIAKAAGTRGNGFVLYAGIGAGSSGSGSGDGVAQPGTAASCFDNGNVAGIQKYSIAQSGGSGLNCALSFQFQ